MPLRYPIMPSEVPCIALVDGDPAIRRARQLMLRAEQFDVRAYPTCRGLLDDPAALRCTCVVADAEMGEDTGVQLLRDLRARGWKGEAILLADALPIAFTAAANDGDFVAMVPKTLGDRALLEAVRSAIRRTCGRRA
jgi:FixJ family two-component response regulator